MSALPHSVSAHKGLRGQILLELKRDQPLTARELAGRFSVSPNAIRRHLKELELEDLVVHDREHRSQGAPAYVYRLSDRGSGLFPRQYEKALTDVLTYVAETSGREQVQRIFAERFKAHAGRLEEQLADASVEERVKAVVELLSRQGFMAEWSVDGDRITIAEHNCAVQAAAEQFPEICQAEAEFLRAVLQTDLKRRAHIRHGCNACEYSMPMSITEEAAGDDVMTADEER
jgi:DeoR family suf operon transcriptional repressor